MKRVFFSEWMSNMFIPPDETWLRHMLGRNIFWMSVKRINETRLGLSVHVGLLCPYSSIQSLQLSARASKLYIKKGAPSDCSRVVVSKQVVANPNTDKHTHTLKTARKACTWAMKTRHSKDTQCCHTLRVQTVPIEWSTVSFRFWYSALNRWPVHSSLFRMCLSRVCNRKRQSAGWCWSNGGKSRSDSTSLSFLGLETTGA